MKKILVLIILLITYVSAWCVEIDGIYYQLDSSKNTATVTGKVENNTHYIDIYKGDLIIPGTVSYEGKKYAVVVIGNEAFKYNTNLTSIILPPTIVSISDNAFCGCTGLSSVSLSSNLQSIGRAAFWDCSNLKSIVLPKSVTKLGSYCFWTGYDIDIYIDDIQSWLKIDYQKTTFANTNKIIYNYIGSYRLFCDGILVDSLKIEDGGYEIKPNVFNGCISLCSVEIPNSVSTVGHYAFANCKNLKEVHLGENVCTLNQACFLNCTSLKEINLPNSLSFIDYFCFNSVSELEKIVIPASVETIREGCFSGDSKLETIIFEDSKKKIILGGTLISSDPMFQDCPIRTIYMGRNITEKTPYYYDGYQISPFLNSTTLENVQIGNEVTIIDDRFFQGCTNIKSIDIPSSVTTIDYEAFKDCASLTDIKMSDNITTLGFDAFSGCLNLPVENGIRYADNIAVELLDKDLDYYELKDGTRIVNDYLFAECKNAMSVTLPNSLYNISKYMFMNCESLNKIEMPSSIAIISEGAFYGCKLLKDIQLNHNITEIYQDTFYDCQSLVSMTIPSSVNSINDCAFKNCNSIKKIVFEDGDNNIKIGLNEKYSSKKYGLFHDCPLEELYLGRNITGFTFQWGENYSFPFYGQSTLKKIYFGQTFKKELCRDYFAQSINIVEVHAPWNIPIDIVNNVFSSQTYTNATLFVPQGSLNLYKTATGWSSFKIINEEIVSDLQNIKKTEHESTKFSILGIKLNNTSKGINIVNRKKILQK